MDSDFENLDDKNIAKIRDIVKQASEKKDSRRKKLMLAAAVGIIAAVIIILLMLFLSMPGPEPIGPIEPPIDLCENGVLDAGEEQIDCGGTCENACAPVVFDFEIKPASVSDFAVNTELRLVYIADEIRHYVMIYDLEFNHIRNIGEMGSAETGFVSGGKEQEVFFFPAAIDLDKSGNLLVLDRDKRIQKFSPEGTFINEIRFEENITETLPKMEDTPHIDGAGLSMAVAPNGEVYVSDELSSMLALFSPDLKLVKAIGGRGTSPVNLVFPGQVTFSNNKVYVADSGNARIQIFDASLDYLDSITEGLKRPVAVTAGEDGKIYVMDSFDSKLKVFDSSYRLVEELGGLGRDRVMFYNATKIKSDSSGNLFIADSGNVRLQELDSEFNFVNSIEGIFGGSITGFPPFYSAIAPDGKIAVTEPTNHRVSIFSASGTYLESIGTKGFGEYEFNMPKGLAFGPQGNLFVNDSQNHRIQVFSPELEYVTSITHQKLFWPVAIAVAPSGKIYVGEDSSKKILIFDKTGKYEGSIYEEKGITLPLGILATEDRVYITDDKEKTIEVFDASLNYIESIGNIDERAGMHVEFNESLALDFEGNLMFCDNRNRKVISYNFDTKEFSSFGDFGKFEDELSVLEIATSADGKTAAVTDMVKYRLFLFNLEDDSVKEIELKDLKRQA